MLKRSGGGTGQSPNGTYEWCVRIRDSEGLVMTSEVLHNGIILPAAWPPRDVAEESDDPIDVPYLANAPDVIPVDVGRQLFVDEFLIESTSLTRVVGKARIHPQSPLLVPETAEELDFGNCPMAAPFNDGVWYDPDDQLFKMWYMPGWFHSVALATSGDGIHWERPSLDVVPGTNLVWPNRTGYDRDGCLVWLDHTKANRSKRYKMFQHYRVKDADAEGWLHTSGDGVHWSEPVGVTTIGDNSSFFYNPFRRKWCMSIRRALGFSRRHELPKPFAPPFRRARWYYECDDLLAGAKWDVDAEEVFWQRTDRLDLPDSDRPDHNVALYDLNVTPYESLMLGLFAIFRGPENDIAAEQGEPKIIDLELGYSRDGFHFSRPDRMPLLASTRCEGDWNRGYLHAVGGVCLVMRDELFIYFTAFSACSPKLGPGDVGTPGRSRMAMYAGAATGLATIRRDGFVGMEAGADGGELTTRPITFKGNRLFVNVNALQGELRVSVLDRNEKPIDGLNATDCIPVCLDSTCTQVSWSSGTDLSAVVGQPLRLRFHLRSGGLFSFWVTDDPAGASYGHMAAGGPGFTGGQDLPKGRLENGAGRRLH